MARTRRGEQDCIAHVFARAVRVCDILSPHHIVTGIPDGLLYGLWRLRAAAALLRIHTRKQTNAAVVRCEVTDAQRRAPLALVDRFTAAAFETSVTLARRAPVQALLGPHASARASVRTSVLRHALRRAVQSVAVRDTAPSPRTRSCTWARPTLK